MAVVKQQKHLSSSFTICGQIEINTSSSARTVQLAKTSLKRPS